MKKKEKKGKNPYRKIIFRGRVVDVYRVLSLFGVNDPAVQHAIKKLLRLGRTHKSRKKDLEEAIQSLERQLQMDKEGTK